MKNKIKKKIVGNSKAYPVVVTRRKFNIINVARFIILLAASSIFGFNAVRMIYEYKPGKPAVKKQAPVKTVNFQGNDELKYLDPVMLIGYFDKGEKKFIVIDTRSQVEYDAGHIKNAENVPLYLDYRKPYETFLGGNDWLNQIRKLSWGRQLVVIYGYQKEADMLLIEAEKLRENGLPVKILGVSWNDWQNNFYQWMPGAAFGGMDINKYIDGSSGKAPPVPPAPSDLQQIPK